MSSLRNTPPVNIRTPPHDNKMTIAQPPGTPPAAPASMAFGEAGRATPPTEIMARRRAREASRRKAEAEKQRREVSESEVADTKRRALIESQKQSGKVTKPVTRANLLLSNENSDSRIQNQWLGHAEEAPPRSKRVEKVELATEPPHGDALLTSADSRRADNPRADLRRSSAPHAGAGLAGTRQRARLGASQLTNPPSVPEAIQTCTREQLRASSGPTIGATAGQNLSRSESGHRDGQGQDDNQGSHPASRTNNSSFPHAFERWEQLSSHWEGLTSFWIRRLEQNQADLDREPLNQQMARQVTDLSAAGANLFHAVVELQRLRASSERKFQRWFFEARSEQETARETYGRLESQLRAERQVHAAAVAESARYENEIKSAYAAKALADIHVKEMRRELSISKEEARRAWEELGRRAQGERERTTSLKAGKITVVGGVQVVPMRAAADQTIDAIAEAGEDPISSNVLQHSISGARDQATGGHAPTETHASHDPFVEHPPVSPMVDTPDQTDARLYSRDPATTAPTASAHHSTLYPPRHSSAADNSGLRVPSSATATAANAFYHHHENLPLRSQSISPSISLDDVELDENGEIRRDANGRPITSRDHGASAGTIGRRPEASLMAQVAHRASPLSMAHKHHGTDNDGPTSRNQAYDQQEEHMRLATGGATIEGEEGQGYEADVADEAEWDVMPRHQHPTRLSEILEEDERSRTSPSRASQRSRGIH